MSYELWTILNKWRSEFSSADFASSFLSPNPRKTLHDMTKKGFLEHLGYGRYRVISTDDYATVKNDVRGAYDLLKEASLSYALTDVDGPFVWTKGGYNAGRFFGCYPIHLKVRKSDAKEWRRFFATHGKKSLRMDSKPRETAFGVFYVLHPSEKVEAETIEGLKVEPLKETVEFCMKNAYTFEPALEMLDREYQLGLGIRRSAS